MSETNQELQNDDQQRMTEVMKGEVHGEMCYWILPPGAMTWLECTSKEYKDAIANGAKQIDKDPTQ